MEYNITEHVFLRVCDAAMHFVVSMGYQGSASVVVLFFGVRFGLASTKQHRTEQKVIPNLT